MKRIFLAILFSFLSVVGAAGLLIGGMYLFGGFNEKIVYAEDLSFNVTEVIENSTFFLKLSTTTEGVTKTRIKLETLQDNSTITYPEYVEIGEVFPIIPKQDGAGNNNGGNVVLRARYDGDNSNQNVYADCNILIDIPVKSIDSINMSTTDIKPGQTIILANKDQAVEQVLDFNPIWSLMPYKKSGTKKINNIVDKVIYMELTNSEGSSVNGAAQFRIENTLQNSDVIKVSYRFDESKGFVFDNNIYIVTSNKQIDIKVNAYIFSTYEEQSKNISVENVVQLVKSKMINGSATFTIGNYAISNFTFDDSTKEIPLNLNVNEQTEQIGSSWYTNNEELYTRIYVNNPDKSNDEINLSINLQSSSEGVEVSDTHYQYMFLKIDELCKDFVSIAVPTYVKGENEQTELKVEIKSTSEPVKVFYSSSTDVKTWRWDVKIKNFEAYKNYVDNGNDIKATLIYNKEGADPIEKTFSIIPKVVETESVSVSYGTGNESIEVESGKTFIIKNQENKAYIGNVKNDDFNLTISPSNATFKDVRYYISYNENYRAIKTVPTVPANTTSGVKYLAKFKLKLNLENCESVLFRKISAYNKGDWCDVDSIEIDDQQINENSSIATNTYIFVKTYITMKNNNYDSSYLFTFAYINSEENSNVSYEFDISIDDVKFYEWNAVKSEYSDIPYLSISGIRYFVDFEPYYDSVTNSRFLRLMYEKENELSNDGNFKTLQGIGSFIITAQLCYVNEDEIFWLSKSARIKVDVYEDLADINAEIYKGDTKVNNVSDLVFDENVEDSYGYFIVSSSTMQTLRNYVEYNQIRLSVTPVFYYGTNKLGVNFINTYSGISAINAGAITFGNWTTVYENNAVVGYKLPYIIGEVQTIVIGNVEYKPTFEITMSAVVNSENVFAQFSIGGNLVSSVEFNVTDIVINNSEIFYDGNTYYDVPLDLYADVSANGVISYKTSSTANFDDNKLGYYLEYSNSAKTIETLSATLSLANGQGSNLQGLASFSVSEPANDNTGKGGLTLNNFPYDDNGVVLALTISSSSTQQSNNSYYLWDGSGFVQTQYYLNKTMYFRVYGLNVTIENKNKAEVYGIKDASIDLFGTAGLFDIVVTRKNSSTPINNITNYSNIININAIENLQINETKTKLTPIIDFIEDSSITFRFSVGGRVINITGGSGYTIKSPFIVEIKEGSTQNQQGQHLNSYTASDSLQTLLTISYMSISSSTHAYEKGPLAIDDEKILVNKVVNSVSYNNDTSLVSVSHGLVGETNPTYACLIGLKLAPVEYVVNLRISMVLNVSSDDKPIRNIDFVINVLNGFNNDDIKIYPSNSAANEEVDDYGYCIIDAGKEYSYAKVFETGSVSEDDTSEVKFLGNFAENDSAWEKKITSISVSFIDDNETNPQDILFMYSTSSSNGKHFTIGSDDLNKEAKIRIVFAIGFGEFGSITLTKKVVVNPNIKLELINKNSGELLTSLTEGNYLQLTNNDSYKLKRLNANTGEFDIIDSSFDIDGDYDNGIYTTSSFEFDENVFVVDPSYNFYTIAVVRAQNGVGGGAASCGGQTTIKFYYYVNGRNNYILEFDFDLHIYVSPVTKDITIQDVDYTKAYTTAVEDQGQYLGKLKIELGNNTNSGIQFSQRLMTLVDNNKVENLEITFEGYNGSTDEFVNKIFSSEVTTYKNGENKGEIENVVIYANDYNEEISAKATFTFTLKNGQVLTYDRIVTLKPNVATASGSFNQTFNEGDSFTLGTLDYIFTLNGQIDNSIKLGLQTVEFETDVLELNEETQTFTVKNGGYVNCNTTGKTTIKVKYNMGDYDIVFDLDVTINNPQ